MPKKKKIIPEVCEQDEIQVNYFKSDDKRCGTSVLGLGQMAMH